MIPSQKTLQTRHVHRFGDCSKFGWRVGMRRRFGYHEGDEWYEAVVDSLVDESTSWLDVGGGCWAFPFNRDLSAEVAARCAYLAVVDPDSDGRSKQPHVDELAPCLIEDYQTDRQFDLATMRMVAEHIADPEAAVAKLAELVRPGGHMVIYTPHKWSPVAMVAGVTPYRFHLFATNLLWGANGADVFPTVYRMNTRRTLAKLLGDAGFCEVGFAYVPNCTTFHRWKLTCAMELGAWRALDRLGIGYPESNLLGVYQKQG